MEEEDKKTVETGVAVEDSGMGLLWALKALTCITSLLHRTDICIYQNPDGANLI